MSKERMRVYADGSVSFLWMRFLWEGSFTQEVWVGPFPSVDAAWAAIQAEEAKLPIPAVLRTKIDAEDARLREVMRILL